MAWFKRQDNEIENSSPEKRVRTEGLWVKCEGCDQYIFKADLDNNQQVCPKCGQHHKIDARSRVANLLEPGYELVDLELKSTDPLNFYDVKSYKSRLAKAQEATGLNDAIVNVVGRLGAHDVVLSVMEYAFIGGSMGSVVGEKLTRLIETATEKGLAIIIVSTSGGARMYEGMFSLMQMAKTCGALAYHAKARLPYISVLTDPTTAGVMASYASVGDLIIAEPGAMIGFAGPRVIKDTTQSELPPGFQTAEFLLDHGLIDAIVPRKEMKSRLIEYLNYLTAGQKRTAA